MGTKHTAFTQNHTTEEDLMDVQQESLLQQIITKALKQYLDGMNLLSANKKFVTVYLVIFIFPTPETSVLLLG